MYKIDCFSAVAPGEGDAIGVHCLDYLDPCSLWLYYLHLSISCDCCMARQEDKGFSADKWVFVTAQACFYAELVGTCPGLQTICYL